MSKNKHNNTLIKTGLKVASGVLLSANMAAQTQDNTTQDSFNRMLDMHAKNYSDSTKYKGLPNPTIDLKIPQTKLDLTTFDAVNKMLDMHAKNIADTAKGVKRDYIKPDPKPSDNSSVVPALIFGVDPMPMITPGKDYLKLKNLFSNNFEVNLKTYDGMAPFINDGMKRINHYKKFYPNLAYRDTRLLEQIVNSNYDRPGVKDSAIIKSFNEYIGLNVKKGLGMILTGEQTTALSQMIADNGHEYMVIPILAFHNGGKVGKETKPGESIPEALVIPGIDFNKYGKTKYVNITDSTDDGNSGKGDIITNITNITNNYYNEKKDSIQQVKKDSIPEVTKDRLRVYVGGGVSYDKLFKIMGDAKLGVQYKKFSVGVLMGFGNMQSNDSLVFPAFGFHPVTGEYLQIGGTTEKTNTKATILRPGIEVGWDIAKNVRACINGHYNMINTNTTGQVTEITHDDAWNERMLIKPIPEVNKKYNHTSLGASLEYQTAFDGPVNVGIGASVELPINPKYGSTKPTYGITARAIFGNARTKTKQ